MPAPSALRTHTRFQVGEWIIEPALNRFTCDEECVTVEPKMMQVMSCLIEEAGIVIRKDVLLARVWKDTVVTEEAVSRVVSALRKVLGDTPRSPRYIETIRKTGYRLIAPVTPLHTQPLTSVPSPHPIRWWIGGLILLALSLVGMMRWSSSDEPPLDMRLTPVTTDSGREIQPSLSPDGSHLAYASRPPNATAYDLFVKVVGTESVLQLTETIASEQYPTWSPDGRWIAFTRIDAEGCALFTIAALGGVEQKRTECPARWVDGLTWSPTSDAIYYSSKLPDSRHFGIYRLDLATDKQHLITEAHYSGFNGAWMPRLSPDGNHLAFLSRRNKGSEDLFLLSFSDDTVRPLTGDGGSIEGLSWQSDNRSLVISSDRDGFPSLWQVFLDGTPPRWISASGPGALNPTSAHLSNHIAYEQRSYSSSIWKMSADTSHAEQQPYSSTRWEGSLQYSPDGTQVAFVSTRSGTLDLWVVNTDGTDLRPLTTNGMPLGNAPRWSPDGRFIAFDSRTAGNTDVYVIGLDSRSPRRITTAQANDVTPNWSNDSQFLYFGSDRSGTWQVWKVPVSGGPATQITQEGGFLAAESMDGKALYLTRYDTSGLWHKPLPDGKATRILDISSRDAHHWVVRPEGIYALQRSDALHLIRYTPFQQTTDVALRLPHDTDTFYAGFTLAPQGNAVLFTQIDHVSIDIMLLTPNS